MELESKRIIVSGCARGMGEATLNAYVQAGADVIGMDINSEAGQSVTEKAKIKGPGKASFIKIDIANPESVSDAFREASEQLGGLDALANPAAIHRLGDPSDISPDDWDRIFTINVRGTVLTNQAAFKLIRKSGGGSIINFGSISGLRPEPGSAAYSATKGAVHSWSRTAAAAWGKDLVRVNAILPAMATPMYMEANKKMTEEAATASYWMNHRSIALGEKYGDPETDLGPVMVFFASDASRFITGQLIPVDGGQASTR
ncbi:MAG: 3-oxoacyl-ACP reductase [Gammaproteobacteria bacterium]|nr:3-oxoacyl-ACP reductase [Gammaproteobacteria bacterium]